MAVQSLAQIEREEIEFKVQRFFGSEYDMLTL